MVPIKRSLGYGCDKHLVIVTKDEGYVRKPSSKMLLNSSKLAYHNQALIDALKIRSDVYYEEMNLVGDLQKEGRALLLRPSKNLGVKRFSGCLLYTSELVPAALMMTGFGWLFLSASLVCLRLMKSRSTPLMEQMIKMVFCLILAIPYGITVVTLGMIPGCLLYTSRCV